MKMVDSIESTGGNAYPHKFHTTHRIPDYIKEFSHIEDGTHQLEVEVGLAGRVMSKRIQGK